MSALAEIAHSRPTSIIDAILAKDGRCDEADSDDLIVLIAASLLTAPALAQVQQTPRVQHAQPGTPKVPVLHAAAERNTAAKRNGRLVIAGSSLARFAAPGFKLTARTGG